MNGKRLGGHALKVAAGHADRIKARIPRVRDPLDVRADANTLSFQNLHADRPRHAQRRGEPSGKLSPAAGVGIAAVLDEGRVIGVRGARRVGKEE
jgi:hypothetical protein